MSYRLSIKNQEGMYHQLLGNNEYYEPLINYLVDASDESKRAITTDVYAYEKLTDTMEDSYSTKIVMDWVYALTQSSVWYRNEYRIHDLCFARYTLNENGQYEIYSDYTWEQIKNFTHMYQNEVNSFEYEFHNEGESTHE